ncbi:MAG TPA: DNA mismatch repair endonuclease MutL [Candidatus Acidoferrales bacterium]|nr:DNA mismatch repair endonuclease MutL [Candidatus Acidoferrales bacterium]
MSRIRILSEDVANRIAAGEVVERPASVVKELVENALDAGATMVRVEVEGGGRHLIRVSDDGSGMSHDDALLAFERHATSKLRTADDLLSIATLGFRGEALPSIASVCRLLLETRTAEEEQGTRVEIAGGKLIAVKPAGVPTGTTVSIGDLFYCVPARRKFLKSDTTELGHIASVVTHYALAHPGKHFALRTPTQEIIHATPVETLAERVYQVFGRQALDELIDVPGTSGPIRANITEPQLEAGEESLAMTVSGYISRPEVQRPNRNAIYIFINRRLVRDRLLLHALTEAYRNVQPPGVFPAALLFLDLPPEEVDVNVHPSKIEVRFRHQQFVHDFTRDALRQALSRARPIAEFPTAMSAQGGTAGAGAGTGAALSVAMPDALQEGAAAAAAGAMPLPSPFSGLGAASRSFGSGGAVAPSDDFALTPGAWRPEAMRFGFPAEAAPGAGGDIAAQFRAAANQDTFEAPAGTSNGDQISELKPLGQVSASYIVAVNAEGLWLVDQHVAHERVLFEQHLQARRAGMVTGQRLLVPLVVELSPRQLVIAEQIAEELAANGFEVAPMGQREVAIQAAPAPVSAPDVERLLREILDAVERENQAISIETLQAKIAASTACHAAIKVNTPLDPPRMQWLLSELAKTECPMSCPHGRPVVLRYSLREIEKAFKRT